jgi:transformer-2 protein
MIKGCVVAEKAENQTDRSRGFGFITMRTTEDAARCIEKLNGFVLQGRPIRVDYSATQKPHQPTPGEYMGVKRPIRMF